MQQMNPRKLSNNETLSDIQRAYAYSHRLSRAIGITQGSERLSSSITELSQGLEGGLRWGELSEWGSPWGSGGREVLLSFLSQLKYSKSGQEQWCLWVQGQDGDANVYPPAWEAKGVDLRYIRFTKSLKPVHDLNPIFMSPFFKFIVLDSPQNLSIEDCQFLGRQARRHQQSIVVVRNYFLSPKKGNVWAKLRLNCWHDYVRDQYMVKVIKGLSPRQISFKINETLN